MSTSATARGSSSTTMGQPKASRPCRPGRSGRGPAGLGAWQVPGREGGGADLPERPAGRGRWAKAERQPSSGRAGQKARPAAGLLKGMFQGYFEDQGFKKIFHNYSFDRHMLKREGIQIRGLQADTLHMARLWDTSRASWEGRSAQEHAPSPPIPLRVSVSGQGERRFSATYRRVQSKLHKEAVAKQAPPPPQASSVLGVRLGGKKLDGVSWGGTSGLHTMVEASPQLLYQPPGRPLEAPCHDSLSIRNLSLPIHLCVVYNPSSISLSLSSLPLPTPLLVMSLHLHLCISSSTSTQAFAEAPAEASADAEAEDSYIYIYI